MSGPRHGLCSKTQLVLALTYAWPNAWPPESLKKRWKKMKQKKAPGPDGITNEMLKHLGHGAQRFALCIYNQSWSTSTVPTIWKETLLGPIPPKKEKKSGILPTTARSVCSVVLEASGENHQQNAHMASWVKLISSFNRNRLLTVPKHRRPTGSLDSKAFDKVWKEGLLLFTRTRSSTQGEGRGGGGGGGGERERERERERETRFLIWRLK